MKKFLIGFISGAVLCGSLAVVAVEYNIYPNPYKVMVDGKETAIEGYNINDKSYFQLRDIGSAVGFQVGFDAENGTVLVSTDPTAVMPDANADPAPTEPTEPTDTPSISAPLPEGADKTEPFINADGNYVFPRGATSYYRIPRQDVLKYFIENHSYTDNGVPLNYSSVEDDGNVTLWVVFSDLQECIGEQYRIRIDKKNEETFLSIIQGETEIIRDVPTVSYSIMTLENYNKYVASWVDQLKNEHSK